ncbi:MAG: hypothetical protein CVU43_22045 [Chloroflexi bacterium HGW-Chloroflexi-5]|jgi:hypothetical protein|nr:MAG: hypothetical protein CVU43_22045 [Chloroflexi bacterium HGW-Chloroflexi-5]
MKLLKIKFGLSGENVDAFGIRFYGEFDSRIEHRGSFSEILTDPDSPPMTKNKRVTLWFIFEKIRPYNRVSTLLGELMSLLKKEGYMVMVSSIDGLVDTTSLDYAKQPESSFPNPNRMHGFNAANGFSITIEKTDAELKFSQREIVVIQDLAIKFGQTVYGRSLKMADKTS